MWVRFVSLNLFCVGCVYLVFGHVTRWLSLKPVCAPLMLEVVQNMANVFAPDGNDCGDRIFVSPPDQSLKIRDPASEGKQWRTETRCKWKARRRWIFIFVVVVVLLKCILLLQFSLLFFCCFFFKYPVCFTHQMKIQFKHISRTKRPLEAFQSVTESLNAHLLSTFLHFKYTEGFGTE